MVNQRFNFKNLIVCFLLLSTISVMAGCTANKATETADDSYVLVKELEFLNQSLEQRSDGNYIYQAQIKNNSKYIIRGISIEVQLSNGNYTTIATQDTLHPDAVSGYIQCFGPSSGKLEDMKATRILINMYDEKMVHTIVEYDVNQNKYTYTEGEPFNEEKPKVLVSDLEFVNPMLTASSNGAPILFEASIKNNSDYSIMGLVYLFEMNDGKNVNLILVDPIEAKEATGKVSCTGPTSGDINEMEAKLIKYSIIDQDGNTQMVTYDVRLGQYFMK